MATATTTVQSPFPSAISKVAVAQICQSVGYHGAQPSAFRSLSDIAMRYIQSLSKLAAASANDQGRTDSNIYDVIAAIEDLSLPRGFSGAGDPRRPLLRSAVMKDIVSFVGVVDEIPFAKPIRTCDGNIVHTKRIPTFAQQGMATPFSHVPMWLPVFPESWAKGGRSENVDRKRRNEELWPWYREGVLRKGKTDGHVQRNNASGINRSFLPVEREKVTFKLGADSVQGCGLHQRICTERKEQMNFLSWKENVENSTCFSSLRKIQRCEVGRCAVMALDISSNAP